jgi:CHAD domain-containing protein
LTTGRCQEFVIEDGDGPVPRRIAAALEPRFTVVQETRRRERQVWLDTFDWRLHAAGLELRQVNSTHPGQLVLTTQAGEPVASQPLPAPRWPSLLGAIPEGPLRDRLDPVAGVRALLVLARTEGTLTWLRVLDSEKKTVARISIQDVSLAQPAAGALPPRLVLVPVRGYQSDTDRAARLLAAADGFTPSPRSAFQAVLAAAGRGPGDCSGTAGAPLTASMQARCALATVLLCLAGAIEANVGFVIRDVDTEFLHDLRVAVRRTRSVLKLAGDVLPGDLAARFAGEFKWLGDLTTPTRDLDVYLTGFDAMAARLRAAAPADIEPLRAQLTARRAVERRKLVRGLRSARFTALLSAWRGALDDAAKPRQARRAKKAQPPGPDVGSLAADRIGRAYRRVAKRGSSIGTAGAAGGPPAEQMHALRKRGKELRYLLEFFGSLYDPAALRRAVKDLKGLQDCLGDFQDAEVQRGEIREFATRMLAQGAAASTGQPASTTQAAAGELAATLLAMGELTAQLHAQQSRARAEVAGRFAEFARADSLRTLGMVPQAAKA